MKSNNNILSNGHSMTRRSHTKILPVVTQPADQSHTESEIDFDDAIVCWTNGKRKMANGCYQYLCEFALTVGRKCSRIVCNESLEDYAADIRTCIKHYHQQ